MASFQDASRSSALPRYVLFGHMQKISTHVSLDVQGVLYAKPFGQFTYGIPPPFNPGMNPNVTLDV